METDYGITPELKDRILRGFAEIGVRCQQDIHEAQNDFQISADLLEIILDQFEDFGLIVMEKMLGGTIIIQLTAHAYDLMNRGGFVGEERVVKASLEKLQLEVESLKKSFPEKAETFTSILANLATVAGFFISK